MASSTQMPRRTRAILWIFPAIVGLFCPTYGSAQQMGRAVLIDEPVVHDLYASGREVKILSPVTGDVVVAGGTVRVLGDVSGDVIAAGWDLTINAQVSDDVRLVGGRVVLAGTVGGHAVIAGRDVRIETDARVSDFAWVAGRHVEIDGQVGGDLRAVGREVALNGQVKGDAELSGRRLYIGDGASIGGDLTWRSPTAPDISASATIGGEIIEASPSHWRHSRGGALVRTVLACLAVILAAGLVCGIFRPWCNQILKTVWSRPWAAMLTGLAVLALTPIIVALLFATRVGFVLAIVLMLTYVLALVLGSLTGIVAAAKLGLARLGDNQRDKLWIQLGAIIVVVSLMGALYTVRSVGILVSTVVMLFGLGALMLDAYRRFKTLRS